MSQQRTRKQEKNRSHSSPRVALCCPRCTEPFYVVPAESYAHAREMFFDRAACGSGSSIQFPEEGGARAVQGIVDHRTDGAMSSGYHPHVAGQKHSFGGLDGTVSWLGAWPPGTPRVVQPDAGVPGAAGTGQITGIRRPRVGRSGPGQTVHDPTHERLQQIHKAVPDQTVGCKSMHGRELLLEHRLPQECTAQSAIWTARGEPTLTVDEATAPPHLTCAHAHPLRALGGPRYHTCMHGRSQTSVAFVPAVGRAPAGAVGPQPHARRCDNSCAGGGNAPLECHVRGRAGAATR